MALINYLRHSGVELPSAIWLRYGRELRRRRAGERRREEEKRKEETRAKGRQEKSRSRGNSPSLSRLPLGDGARSKEARRFCHSPTWRKGFSSPLLHTLPLWFMEKKKMVTQVRLCVAAAPALLFHSRAVLGTRLGACARGFLPPGEREPGREGHFCRSSMEGEGFGRPCLSLQRG